MSVETPEDEGRNDDDEEDETPTKVLLASGVCSFVIGALAAYAFMNIGTAAMAVAFVVGVAGSGYYLSQMEFPEEVVGSASYVAGSVLVAAPSTLYLSNVVFGGQEVTMFPGVNGSVTGIFVEGDTDGGGLAEIDSVGEMLFGQGGPDLETVTQGTIEGFVPLVTWTVVYMMAALVLFALGVVLRNRGDRLRRRRYQGERD
jgi:hypothetical protein